MSGDRRIVILTGAGISAESGIPTFRGPGGLWEGNRVEEVATPEAFESDPELVHRFYNERRRRLQTEVEPNDAHRALARLEAEFGGELVLVTQNVDDLHERAGSRRVLHIHGQLLQSRCVACGVVLECREDLSSATVCGDCGETGSTRPDVVWFGETPYFVREIEDKVRTADLYAAVGTSGLVHPPAGFVHLARHLGVRTLEVNLERTEGSEWFHETLQGRAGELIPAWVEAILAGEA